jgi:hypothetical protein
MKFIIRLWEVGVGQANETVSAHNLGKSAD